MDKDDLQFIRGVLFKTNTFPLCFYGKYSRLSLGLSIDGKCQVSIAPALDPNNKEKPKAGEVRYVPDDQKLSFTLTNNECYHIIMHWKSLCEGKYTNNNPKVKNQKALSVTHFDNKNLPSFLSLEDDGKGGIKLSIFTTDKKNASFVLSDNPQFVKYEKQRFYDFVKNTAQNNPYQQEYFKSVIKMTREILKKCIEEGVNTNVFGNNGGGGNSNRSSNTSQSRSNNSNVQTEEYDPYSEEPSFEAPDNSDNFSSQVESDNPFDDVPF